MLPLFGILWTYISAYALRRYVTNRLRPIPLCYQLFLSTQGAQLTATLLTATFAVNRQLGVPLFSSDHAYALRS